MRKKINFVYLTVNLLNNKGYVGDHSTNNLHYYKTKNYLGSGDYIKNAIKKYGKENFERRILEFFDSKETAFNAQEKYIKEYNTLHPNGYNISPKGGYGVPDSFLNEETKKKIGISNKGKLKGRVSPNKGKKFSDEHKKKIGEANKISLKGKKQTQQTKNKKVNKMIGKIHSEETKQKMKKPHKKFSEETKQKMKNKIISIETKKKISLSLKTYFNNPKNRIKTSVATKIGMSKLK